MIRLSVVDKFGKTMSPADFATQAEADAWIAMWTVNGVWGKSSEFKVTQTDVTAEYAAKQVAADASKVRLALIASFKGKSLTLASDIKTILEAMIMEF